MKKVDYIIWALFIIAMAVFCFLKQCSMDVYFIILGFLVAIVAMAAMIIKNKKNNE